MNSVYIHYGSSKYEPDKFKPIKNSLMWTKQEGGLWASPKDAAFGWKEWCINTEFKECNIDKSFEFTLAPNARILQINNKHDLADLPKTALPKEIPSSMPTKLPWALLDFEKLVASGVDAIQVNMSKDTASKHGDRLLYVLNGWITQC